MTEARAAVSVRAVRRREETTMPDDGFCSNCGKERRPGAAFCTSCGTRFEPAAAQGTTPAAVDPAPYQAPQAQVPAQWPAGAAYPAAQPGAPAARMRLSVLPLIGVGGLVLGLLLPWAEGGTGSFDVPVTLLWDLNADDMFIKVGMVLVAIAVLGALVILTGKVNPLRRVLGGLGAAVGIAFIVQLYRFVSALDGGVGDVFDSVGVGVYVTVVAGVLMTLGK